ncbi:CotS family spore coat protein [Clostridium sp. CM028]|uniref:CotS family spore coat protein n=1 Tax=unclassified Clostridium TaxID=2614128 RepID=UPI001C0BB79C|nr:MULTISPECIES: CotS family spore coat protein [unclassified Clostridium]MBU3092599.1 CotS family spore coat protein [Clostridium sp. CF011]MBW9146200.1 CotS family spore coat protein [Clostridium sp. CM027]MBW9149672.1 CotS family spore coat protein [Clostridium sp. CM028]UVE39820.1 CotS family spore coat protein [Clostridium sp. CM027]WAG68727.1 CotS family spore coat protein [Clostridium sp. CF011]
MEIQEVKETVQDNYSLCINDIVKIKNVYRIETENDMYCLKIINYDFKHFLFIIGAIKHLQGNGFENIPEIIETIDNKEYIAIENKYAYLTPWLKARECNYDNPVEIKLCTSKLAELHKKSLNFKVTPDMSPRIGWLKWIETFKTREREILDFKRRIGEKECITEFDSDYLRIMGEELARSNRSIENLCKSEYVSKMKGEIKHRGFCHHDYAHHNVLLDKSGGVNVIDFDYCILDTHLHDLSSLLIRRMKNGKWSPENALFIMEAYDDAFSIYKSDIEVMAAFMEFPQEYWQIGIQYYWEKKDWGEEFFLRKLEKMREDRVDKQIFIEKFIKIKYGR